MIAAPTQNVVGMVHKQNRWPGRQRRRRLSDDVLHMGVNHDPVRVAPARSRNFRALSSNDGSPPSNVTCRRFVRQPRSAREGRAVHEGQREMMFIIAVIAHDPAAEHGRVPANRVAIRHDTGCAQRLRPQREASGSRRAALRGPAPLLPDAAKSAARNQSVGRTRCNIQPLCRRAVVPGLQR